jgi:DNA-binding response OmpR family regulator
MTIGRLFIVDWDKESARARAEALRAAGWTVDIESEDGARAYRRIREQQPDVVLVDLSVKPSHGLETIKSLAKTKATLSPALVIVGVTDAIRDKVAAVAPHVVFANASDLAAKLSKVLPNRPK